MPNLVNQMVTRELESDVEGADAMVVVTFGGLTVAETEKLRNDLAEGGVRLRMVRNKLAKRVLSGRGMDFEDATFVGNTAIAFGNAEAAIHAAKVFTDKEVKKEGKVQVKGGLLEGAVLSAPDAAALAGIPDRQTLNAQLLGVISGPARSLVSVLSAVPGGVARVLQAHADQGEGAE